MDYSQPLISEDAQCEILQLNEQLHMRDQLVDQLSTELYRLIKANPAALPPANGSSVPSSATLTPYTSDGDPLEQEVTTLESQIEFYQTQIDKRDAQIAHLQNSCQTLSERNQKLEHVMQGMHEVYRQKYSNRLEKVKTKLKFLEIENRRLYSALQDSDDSPTAQRMSLPSRSKASREQTP